MKIVNESTTQLQDLPAGIYFIVSKNADFHAAVQALQYGLNNEPYSHTQLLHILATTEAIESPLQPGHFTMVHIVTAVVKLEKNLVANVQA